MEDILAYIVISFVSLRTFCNSLFKNILFKILKLHLFIHVYICVSMWAHMCHGVPVDVRGWLLSVFSPSIMSPEIEHGLSGLVMHLYTLSHLACPQNFSFKCDVIIVDFLFQFLIDVTHCLRLFIIPSNFLFFSFFNFMKFYCHLICNQFVSCLGSLARCLQ